jgi:hypothetical protein
MDQVPLPANRPNLLGYRNAFIQKLKIIVMKKKLFPIAVFVLFISLFSLNSFGQSAPGDSGSGGVDGEVPSQPSPVSFKRNNGNGTCGGEAQIRVAFDKKPDWFPFIEEIKYEGHSIPVVFGDIDASQLARKGYVSYCILSGNLPAAGKIAIKFHYYKTNQTFWMNLNQ